MYPGVSGFPIGVLVIPVRFRTVRLALSAAWRVHAFTRSGSVPISARGITVPSRLSRPLAWHSAQCCSKTGRPLAARAGSIVSGYLGAGRFINQSSRSFMRCRKKAEFCAWSPSAESRITAVNEVVAPARFMSISRDGSILSFDQSASAHGRWAARCGLAALGS
jgi:hypothetical protein